MFIKFSPASEVGGDGSKAKLEERRSKSQTDCQVATHQAALQFNGVRARPGRGSQLIEGICFQA